MLKGIVGLSARQISIESQFLENHHPDHDNNNITSQSSPETSSVGADDLLNEATTIRMNNSIRSAIGDDRSSSSSPAQPAFSIALSQRTGELNYKATCDHKQQNYSQAGREEKPLNLEFDGTTVLCRVCGDKASGFHYGVHSCEGCKGFFRRSIQQKIQYRPCLKNQQCSILRINRNRCQYCRLKKCMGVGMSRDAVRFGRVPKREKAKILAEMSRVINATRYASTSTKTDSSSTPPPAVVEDGARIVVENESYYGAQLDLNAIVEAHYDTFRHPLGMVEVSRLKEYRTWALSKQNFTDGHDNNTDYNTECPFSEVLGNFLPAQQENLKNGGSGGYAKNYTSAIHDVVEFAKRIPGFTSLHQEDQLTLLKTGVLEVLLVRMCRFFDSQTDSVLLTDGRLMKRPHMHSKGDDLNNVTMERRYHRTILFDAMFNFAHRFNSLDLSEPETALFTAAVLVASDRAGIKNLESVACLQDRIIKAMRHTLLRNEECQSDGASLMNGSLFTRVIMKVPELRNLNELHSEKVIMFKILANPPKSSDQTFEFSEQNLWTEWPRNGDHGSNTPLKSSMQYKRQYTRPVVIKTNVEDDDEQLKMANVEDMSVLRSCLEKANAFDNETCRELSLPGSLVHPANYLYPPMFIKPTPNTSLLYSQAEDETQVIARERIRDERFDMRFVSSPILGRDLIEGCDKLSDKDEILRAFLSRPKPEADQTDAAFNENLSPPPSFIESRRPKLKSNMCSSRSARKKELKTLSINKDVGLRMQNCEEWTKSDSPKTIASSFSLPDAIDRSRHVSPRSCSSMSPPKRVKIFKDHPQERRNQDVIPKTMTPLQSILSRNPPITTVLAQQQTISPHCASSYPNLHCKDHGLGAPWINPFVVRMGHPHMVPYQDYNQNYPNMATHEGVKLMDPFALLKMLPTPPPDHGINNSNLVIPNIYGLLPSELATAAYYKAATALALSQQKQSILISSLSPPQDEVDYSPDIAHSESLYKNSRLEAQSQPLDLSMKK